MQKTLNTQERKQKIEQTDSDVTISFKSFITVVLILSFLLVFSGVLSYVIPQGSFERDAEGTIIANSFTYKT